MTGKLHELLAVEPDLKADATRVMNETLSLFKDGQGKLVGQVRTYRPIEEGGETFPDESTQLATTVDEELGGFEMAMGRWINAAVQKESTNSETSADVLIGELSFIEALPATALLNLEARLQEIRRVYAAIPTLDPTERWNFTDGEYVSDVRFSYRTQKIPKSMVMYEATEEHPAQVQGYTEDRRIGEWETIIRSGMLTRTEKQERLGRIDKLFRAVKKARQRANDIDALKIEVADDIFNYINTGDLE